MTTFLSPLPAVVLVLTFVLSALGRGAAAYARSPGRDVAPPTVAPDYIEAPDQPPAAAKARRLGPSATVTRNGWTSVQVNVDASGANILGDAGNEPSIAIDPTNPNRIAIGWRQFDSVESNFRQAGYAFSRDAGRTWTFPGVLEDDVFRSDPVLDCDADGVFYYYSLTNPGFQFCDLFKSTDGGESWTGPVFAEGGDKAWMTIDKTDGVGRGVIYGKWGNFFTRSTDRGLTFDEPVATPRPGGWGTVAVGPDGAVYGAGAIMWGMISYVRSETAQDPNSPLGGFTGGPARLGGRIQGFENPNPGGGLGQVWVAVDSSSGDTRGNVYVLASVRRAQGTDPLDVKLIRSTDGGATWSDPVRVNDDPNGVNAFQWFGTMAVAPTGRIDVIWNDTRNDPNPSDPDWSELYYSFSDDGGETWAANVPISPPFNHFLGYPQQNKIGDYYHIISDAVGVSVAYAATFNGEQDVWFLRIGDYDCNGNGIADADDLVEGTSEDLNGNGVPDECDCLGDLDADWTVGLADLGILLANLGVTQDAHYEDGDLDEDGDVDPDDLELLLFRYGLSCP